MHFLKLENETRRENEEIRFLHFIFSSKQILNARCHIRFYSAVNAQFCSSLNQGKAFSDLVIVHFNVLKHHSIPKHLCLDGLQIHPFISKKSIWQHYFLSVKIRNDALQKLVNISHLDLTFKASAVFGKLFVGEPSRRKGLLLDGAACFSVESGSLRWPWSGWGRRPTPRTSASAGTCCRGGGSYFLAPSF